MSTRTFPGRAFVETHDRAAMDILYPVLSVGACQPVKPVRYPGRNLGYDGQIMGRNCVLSLKMREQISMSGSDGLFASYALKSALLPQKMFRWRGCTYGSPAPRWCRSQNHLIHMITPAIMLSTPALPECQGDHSFRYPHTIGGSPAQIPKLSNHLVK